MCKYLVAAFFSVLPFQSWAADAIGDATPVADPVPIYDTEMRGSADVYASGFYVRYTIVRICPPMFNIAL